MVAETAVLEIQRMGRREEWVELVARFPFRVKGSVLVAVRETLAVGEGGSVWGPRVRPVLDVCIARRSECLDGTGERSPAPARVGIRCRLQLESGCGGHHWSAPGVNGGDDLLGVDALQVDRCGAEVGVPELALDEVERYALASKFDRVGMAQLVGREPTANPSLGGEAAKLHPDPCA